MKKKYPDMTELFALKEARRRKLANLPVAEKMEIAQRLREIGNNAPGRSLKQEAKKAKWRLIPMQPKKRDVA
jgi:hypothetical protein